MLVRERRGVPAIVGRYPRPWLFAGLTLLYVATASYRAISIDVAAAEGPAWSLAVRGTLDLAEAGLHDLPWYFEHDGGLYSDRFPGAIMYLVPSYWVASLLGFSSFSFVPGALTAAVVTALGVSVLHGVFARVFADPRATWSATSFVALGTGVWSIAANAPWSHTLNFFLIAAALSALSRDRFALAGLVLGLAVTSRPTVAVGIATLGVALALWRRSWRDPIVLGLSAVPGILLLFAYNGLMFGHWGPSNGHELRGEIGVRWAELPVNLVGVMFSPSRGALFFYPILLVAALGMASAWRSAQAWEKAAALAGLAVLVTQLSLDTYTGGDTFFGSRLVLEPLTFAAPILARAVVCFAIDRGGRLVKLVMMTSVGLHAAGAILLPY